MEKVLCTLCNSENTTYLPSRIRNDAMGEYKMYACSDCETHFLYPRPASEQLQDYYDGKFREEVHTQTYYDEGVLGNIFRRCTPEAKMRVERIENELSKDDDVLEIGCSVGYFLEAVAHRVNSVCGTEWDHKAQQYIRKHTTQDNVRVASNPEDFNKTFDKIFMFHVLEHIEDPVAFLESLKNMLKPNGCIYIEVPNVDDVLVKTYQCESFKNYYYKKAHLYNFNERGLMYIFECTGYKYTIDFIQRYDLSNHLHWLHKGLPGGKGLYAQVLGEEVNDIYVKSLKEQKQTDTLFAKIWL